MSLIPASQWNTFNVKSEKDFQDRYVLRGIFHDKVDQQIVKYYTTIEKLLEHAYYEYKFIDVALSQLMGLFEFAVKIRCIQLGIKLSFKDQRKKIRKKTLNTLIDELIKKGLTDEFRNIMHDLRKLRNYTMHPEKNILIGAASLSPILITINSINQLFLPKTYHVKNHQTLQEKKARLKILKNTLFIMPWKEKKVLVYLPRIWDLIKVKGKWIWIISFETVINYNQNQLSQNYFPPPILKFFTKFDVGSEGIKVSDFQGTHNYNIRKNEDERNIIIHTNFLSNLFKLNKQEWQSYKFINEDALDLSIQNFIYRNCWNN